MEIQSQSQFKSLSKQKLPTKADWWRDVDETKGKNPFGQIISIESPTPDILPVDNQGPEGILRNTTMVSSGDIEISGILFPIQNYSERQIYEKNCERLHCPTSRKFGKTLDNVSLGLQSEEVHMAHYGLTSKGVKATAISISNLSQCSIIDLRGNTLNAGSLSILVSVMMKSPVTEINLSSTGISKFGSGILSKWIATSMRIKKLYLRDNRLDEVDGITLFEAVASNRSLAVLDVAENLFCIRCADALKKLLDDNDTLEVLDLSWNNLRQNATMSIAKGLKKNNGIKHLTLNWNGLEDVGVKELGLAMKENDCLQDLELVSNRITDKGFEAFMKCLEKNVTLKSIKIGRNHIEQSTAGNILDSLAEGELKDCGLETLDFTGIIFNATFQLKVDSIKEAREGFICLYGYGDSYGKRKTIATNFVKEAFQFLKSYIEEKNINFVELYQKFDLDGNMSVTYEEFRLGLTEANIPLSDDQVERLIDYLDSDRDGEIDLSELVVGLEDQHYIDTQVDGE